MRHVTTLNFNFLIWYLWGQDSLLPTSTQTMPLTQPSHSTTPRVKPPNICLHCTTLTWPNHSATKSDPTQHHLNNKPVLLSELFPIYSWEDHLSLSLCSDNPTKSHALVVTLFWIQCKLTLHLECANDPWINQLSYLSIFSGLIHRELTVTVNPLHIHKHALKN